MTSHVNTLGVVRRGAMAAAMQQTQLLGFQSRRGGARAKAAFVGYNQIVVNDTSDTTHTPVPGPTVSLRDAVTYTKADGVSLVSFSLPANSTITLATALPNPTAFQRFDFTGVSNLTINGASSVVRDYAGVTIYGGFTTGTSAGLFVNSPSATANLVNGAFINATGTTIAASVQQGTLLLQNGSSLSAIGSNTINAGGTSVYAINLLSGATVSDSSTVYPTIFLGSETVGGTVSNSGTISSSGSGAYSGGGASRLTNNTGGVVTSSATTGSTSTVVLNDTASVNNAGSITNTRTTATGNAIYVSGAGTVTNSGTISTTSSNGYAIGLQSGATVTSTGMISAKFSDNYAIDSFGTTGTTTIDLKAASSTTGAVGGTGGSALAITVAGTLNGDIVGGTEADAVRLVNGLNFVRTISLGGGADVLTLDGDSGSSSLLGNNVVSSVALVKSGAGTWVLVNQGTNYSSIAFNAGVLELKTESAAGSGLITFGAGAQTLQLDIQVRVDLGGGFFQPGAPFALSAKLNNFGAEDKIDIHNTTATSTSVSGDRLTVNMASGFAATLTFAPGQLSNRAITLASDGAGGSFVTLAAAPPIVIPPPTTTTNTPSSMAAYPTQTSNILHVSASAQAAAAADPSSSLGRQLTAEKQIAADLDAGKLSPQDAQSALFHLVDGTTSAAEISYAFFTGATPNAAGLAYLVDPTVNPNSLNSGYYATLTIENRYVNLAVSLSTGQGAGAAAFAASYGSLSVADATAKAYGMVFGGPAPTAEKIGAILNALVSDGRGGMETRAAYFADITGGGSNTLAQKAAIIGFLLADSVKEGFGTYQQADQHFLQDLAHGTAAYGVDLLGAYTAPVTVTGAPVADHSAGA